MDNTLAQRLSGAVGLVLSILAAIAIGVVIIFFTSDNPGLSLHSMFVGPFTSAYFFGNMLEAATPLIFTGLGIALAFRSSAFNLGVEGQVHTGALVGTMLIFFLPPLNPWLWIPVILLGGALAAGLQAAISGALRAYFGANELITAYMISMASINFFDFVLGTYLLDPRSSVLQTPAFPIELQLPKLLFPSQLNLGFVVALVMAVAVYVFMFKTTTGYELRMAGLNREFSTYVGINTNRTLILAMLLSGFLAGLGGMFNTLGIHERLVTGFSADFGFKGITVALIARNHPLAVVPAALLYSYLESGASIASLMSDVSPQIAGIVQSVIFYLVTAQAVYAFVHRMMSRSKAAGPGTGLGPAVAEAAEAISPTTGPEATDAIRPITGPQAAEGGRS